MPSLKQNVLTCKWNFDKKTKYYYIYKKKRYYISVLCFVDVVPPTKYKKLNQKWKNCLMRNDDVAAQLCTKVKLTKATRARVLHLTFHSQESLSRQGPYCCRPVRMGKVGQQQVWHCDRDWRFSIEEHKEEDVAPRPSNSSENTQFMSCIIPERDADQTHNNDLFFSCF